MTTRSFTEFGLELDRVVADASALSALWLRTRTSDPAAIVDAASALHARTRVLLAEIRTLDVLDVVSAPTDVLDLLTWGLGMAAELQRLGGRLLQLIEAATIARGSILTQQRGHFIRSGDTFQSVALEYYGTWEKWMIIAEANSMNPAAALVPGSYLTIPEPDGRRR